MQTINIHDAKTQFSKLIDAVEHGAQVTIARAGRPVATLTAITAPVPKRKPGALKGKIKISRDFDAALPAEIQAAFEGR